MIKNALTDEATQRIAHRGQPRIACNLDAVLALKLGD